MFSLSSSLLMLMYCRWFDVDYFFIISSHYFFIFFHFHAFSSTSCSLSTDYLFFFISFIISFLDWWLFSKYRNISADLLFLLSFLSHFSIFIFTFFFFFFSFLFHFFFFLLLMVDILHIFDYWLFHWWRLLFHFSITFADIFFHLFSPSFIISFFSSLSMFRLYLITLFRWPISMPFSMPYYFLRCRRRHFDDAFISLFLRCSEVYYIESFSRFISLIFIFCRSTFLLSMRWCISLLFKHFLPSIRCREDVASFLRWAFRWWRVFFRSFDGRLWYFAFSSTVEYFFDWFMIDVSMPIALFFIFDADYRLFSGAAPRQDFRRVFLLFDWLISLSLWCLIFSSLLRRGASIFLWWGKIIFISLNIFWWR